MDSTGGLVTLEDIQAAAAALDGVAQRTPVEPSRAVSEAAGAQTLLKCEHLQRTGSFKIRGAYNRIRILNAEERARGVVCASAGNHAQGVALSASSAGTSATVFMPEGAPLPKVDATRSYGAQVRLVGDGFAEAFAAAQAWAEDRDAVFIHPFDHPTVIAGQGTIGLEIVEQVPDLAAVIVAIGGGGLAAGVATAVKALRPDVVVVGVQAEDPASTIADGIAVKAPGELTMTHVRERVDEVVTVTDAAIARAVLLLVERAKQVVEPAGAAPLAALLDRVVDVPGPAVVVLGGGNVDPMLLLRIIQSGMREEGRYFSFRTRLDDRPGALSRLLSLLAELDANVVAVEHHRFGPRLDLLEVEVLIEVETRGPEHIKRLVGALIEQHYPVA